MEGETSVSEDHDIRETEMENSTDLNNFDQLSKDPGGTDSISPVEFNMFDKLYMQFIESHISSGMDEPQGGLPIRFLSSDSVYDVDF